MEGQEQDRAPTGEAAGAAGPGPIGAVVIFTLAALALAAARNLMGELPPEGAQVPRAMWWTTLLAAPLLVIALGLSALVARRLSDGATAVAGPLWTATLLLLSGRTDWELGRWSVVEGALIRAALLSVAAALTLRGLRDRSIGQREAVLAVLLPLVLVSVPTLPMVVDGGRGAPLVQPPTLVDVWPDGDTALYTSQPTWIFGPRKAWIWRDGAMRAVGRAGVTHAAVGPQGSAALLQHDPLTRGTAEHLTLLTPDTRQRSCKLEWSSVDDARLSFRADGRVAVALLARGQALAVASVDDQGACTFQALAEGEPPPDIGFDASGRLTLNASDTTPALTRVSAWHAGTLDGDTLTDPGTGATYALPPDHPRAAPRLATGSGGPRAFFLTGPVCDLYADRVAVCRDTTLL